MRLRPSRPLSNLAHVERRQRWAAWWRRHGTFVLDCAAFVVVPVALAGLCWYSFYR